MGQNLRTLRQRIKYALWALNGFFGKAVSLRIPQKATVLITYYEPVRMKHIEPQIRNILKCDFVEKLIISNHNPEISIEEKVKILDDRLVFLNQDIRRPCGYRWRIISSLQDEFIISIDDDIRLFPSQLKTLFLHLVNEPEIPHGVSGMIHLENDELQYRERENLKVNYLCEIYAITKNHVKRYFEMERLLAEKDGSLPDLIESYHDFILISQSGSRNPMIHKVGRIYRSNTFTTPGVAIHKEKQWESTVLEVARAVKEVRREDSLESVNSLETNTQLSDRIID